MVRKVTGSFPESIAFQLRGKRKKLEQKEEEEDGTRNGTSDLHLVLAPQRELCRTIMTIFSVHGTAPRTADSRLARRIMEPVWFHAPDPAPFLERCHFEDLN